MDRKILIILAGMCMLLPLISATQIYSQDTEVDLKVPCFNNDTYCSGAAECNITIFKFDGGLLVDSKSMTSNTAYHNYTLNVSDTEDSGEYRAQVVCIDSGEQGKSTFTYIITPTGKSTSVSSAIVQGLIMVLMFGVTIFFLIYANLTEAPGVKLFFNLISYIVMLLTVGTGYILLQSSEIQSNVSTTVNGLLYIVATVFLIIMFYVMINQTKYALQLMQIKKGYGSEFDDPRLI